MPQIAIGRTGVAAINGFGLVPGELHRDERDGGEPSPNRATSGGGGPLVRGARCESVALQYVPLPSAIASLANDRPDSDVDAWH
jgi:hypothetical protein